MARMTPERSFMFFFSAGGLPARALCGAILSLSFSLTFLPAGEPLPELTDVPLALPEASPLPEVDTGAEIVISATRITRGGETVDLSADASVETSVGKMVDSARNYGSSFTVITGAEIERRLDRSLSDVLMGENGVTVSPTGMPGAATGMFIRGANSSATSVMLDGVRLNSQIANGGSGMHDLSSVLPLNISQITVMRGASSTLYGSQAMGGAVDMQLRKGQGKPTGSFASEFGASGENLLFRERLASQGGNDRMNYSIGAFYDGTDGSRSSAREAPGQSGRNEADGFWSHGFNGRFGVTPNENVEISLTSLYQNNHARVDSGAWADSPTAFTETETFLARPKLWLGGLDGLWESELGFAYLQQKQWSGDRQEKTDAHYDSRDFVADWKGTLRLPEISTTVVGAEFRCSTGEIYGAWAGKLADLEKNNISQTDVYFSQQLRFFADDRWVTNFGARLSAHETAGTHTVWHADSIFHVFETGTSFKVSGGSGFRAPTLYEMYMPRSEYWGSWSQGNKNLRPEKSLGWEAGIIQEIFEGRNRTEASFFYTHYDQMIAWSDCDYQWGMPMGGTYENLSNVVNKGVELQNTTRLFDVFTFTAGYTYLDSRCYDRTEYFDWQTMRAGADKYNKRLARRPEHQFTLRGNLELLEKKLNLNSELVYYGECYNEDTNKIMVPEAWVWNLGASYRFNEHFRTYGKLTNLLRQNYCRADGYQSEGMGGFWGVEVAF